MSSPCGVRAESRPQTLFCEFSTSETLLVDGILYNPLCLKSSEMIVQTETAPYELILANLAPVQGSN